MDYLPSKQFIKTVITALLVILGAWFVFYGANKFIVSNKKAPPTPQEIASTKAYQDVNRDSDNDGLKDWEEAIWGTDPHNPDTDGDGTTDGDEVKLHRDPLKAGPNDSLDTVANIAQSATTTLTNQLNLDFATRYLITSGLNGGQPLNTSQKLGLEDIFSQNLQKTVANHQDMYAQKDVIISVIKSPREYINEVAQADKTYFSGISGSELDIVRDALTTKDYSQLQKLDPHMQAYDKLIKFMLAEKVPPSYLDFHLELLNSIDNLKYSDGEMKKIATDPLAVVAGAKIYGEQIKRLFADFKNLKANMDRDNIVFNENEPGRYYYQYF